ncbi:MAG: hypothetical protein KME17_24870 [Cyanosarcina radialis HA8281-LM2]|jgi:ElaB/YqjD/DUF883 family membrane-anchored ribosome-binding protein|nr:hypothetical protein [Cyanosarcina radialis HA8281-LM2]
MEKYDEIFDALRRVLEAAEYHQSVADSSIKAMTDATAKLDRKAEELKGQIHREIEASLKSASEQAVNILTRKFHSANKYAQQATECYKRAVNWAAWKVFAVATISGLFVIGCTTLLLQQTIPTYSEIEVLREEKLQLESEISELEKLNPQIKFSNCIDNGRKRLCVKTDEKAPVYEEGYRILAGH